MLTVYSAMFLLPSLGIIATPRTNPMAQFFWDIPSISNAISMRGHWGCVS